MFESHISLYILIAPFVALLLALIFEFVNGFHDTANAVATVIYTHTLKPMQAVILSGIANFAGAVLSSGAVAFGIVALLPMDWVILTDANANNVGLAMIFSVLSSAIIWNIGTWLAGLPASSSHTLIGSILGVALTNSWYSYNGSLIHGVNWSKALDIGLALLFSPLIGFTLAGLLLISSKYFLKDKRLYEPPISNAPPPFWIRTMLVLTCTGVSFAHGSNDGQKGMGLIMILLVAAMPFGFAVNPDVPPETWGNIAVNSVQATDMFNSTNDAKLIKANDDLALLLQDVDSFNSLPRSARPALRNNAYWIEDAIPKIIKTGSYSKDEQQFLNRYRNDLRELTFYIPVWVKIMVATALGLGTMIGWKRITVTIGERIGNSHLTYAQGAAAELVAVTTIGAADILGLPVSTTHVLSSGVAGTMIANHGGLQMKTIYRLLAAWVLTFPICVFLGTATSAAALHLLLGP